MFLCFWMGADPPVGGNFKPAAARVPAPVGSNIRGYLRIAIPTLHQTIMILLIRNSELIWFGYYKLKQNNFPVTRYNRQSWIFRKLHSHSQPDCTRSPNKQSWSIRNNYGIRWWDISAISCSTIDDPSWSSRTQPVSVSTRLAVQSQSGRLVERAIGPPAHWCRQRLAVV